jgi:hypothetical protein
MKAEQHLHVGLDYLGRAAGSEVDNPLMAAMTHLLAALAIDKTILTPASDETAVIPRQDDLSPEVEPWIVATANGDHTVWVKDSGDMQWLPIGHLSQPSWRQLFVEKRPWS